MAYVHDLRAGMERADDARAGARGSGEVEVHRLREGVQQGGDALRPDVSDGTDPSAATKSVERGGVGVSRGELSLGREISADESEAELFTRATVGRLEEQDAQHGNRGGAGGRWREGRRERRRNQHVGPRAGVGRPGVL